MSVKIIDRGWNRIAQELQRMKGVFVKVGYPQEKPKVHQGKNKTINIAELAAIHEFGTEKIPARPFQAQTFDKNIDRLKAHIEKSQQAIYKGAQTVAKALHLIGNFYKGEMQRTIREGDFAPLSQVTIEKKGSSKPLIDTGQLRQSVDYEIGRDK